MTASKETFTYTFSEAVENHVGMKPVGQRASRGFTFGELQAAQEAAGGKGCATELIDLQAKLPVELRTKDNGAWILICRRLAPALVDEKLLRKEVDDTKAIVDKQAWMKGRVVEKHARWNLCFAETAQEPAYAEKKGRVVPFAEVPVLARFRDRLPEIFGSPAHKLLANLNHYYDVKNTGISYHGSPPSRLVCTPLIHPVHWQRRRTPNRDWIAHWRNDGLAVSLVSQVRTHWHSHHSHLVRWGRLCNV